MALVLPFDGFNYHPHQAKAIQWMMRREDTDAEYFRGGILADEMGLGKTWMTIGLLLNSPLPHTLLLVPPVLQPQWIAEFERCGIPCRVLGTGGSWSHHPGNRTMLVSVATYDRATNNHILLGLDAYDRIVCDEGHVFRNGPVTKRYSRLSAIESPLRWILSGTPVQNRSNDFRNLCRWCGLSVAVAKTNLGALASSVLLRRTVDDVREFVPTMPTVKPTHFVHPLTMPADGEEERVFEALVGRFQHAVEVHAASAIILELYLRIRQFLAHPDIYVNAMKRKYKNEYGRQSWSGTATKMSGFREFLRESAKEPTIVFGTFHDELDLAEDAMKAAGYTTFLIRGGMSDKARTAALTDSRAIAATGAPVGLVIQIVAGGAGLNIQHCSRVVFLSSHWNPAMVDQAIARSYRMGQTETVSVHHFLLANNAERNVDRLMAFKHGMKRDIATAIHPKLYCDSAVAAGRVQTELDAVLPQVVAGYNVEDEGVEHDE